jgi:hypothetical protein
VNGVAVSSERVFKGKAPPPEKPFPVRIDVQKTAAGRSRCLTTRALFTAACCRKRGLIQCGRLSLQDGMDMPATCSGGLAVVGWLPDVADQREQIRSPCTLACHAGSSRVSARTLRESARRWQNVTCTDRVPSIGDALAHAPGMDWPGFAGENGEEATRVDDTCAGLLRSGGCLRTIAASRNACAGMWLSEFACASLAPLACFVQSPLACRAAEQSR